MGLDICLFRVTKPHDIENRVYTREELSFMELSAIPASLLQCQEAEDLAPYCQEIQLKIPYINIEKIREDYSLPESAEVVMQSGDGSICVSTGSDKSSYIDISYEVLQEKYLNIEVESYAAFQKTEVGYWRKDYDVAGFFSEQLEKTVENTGYYALSAEILEKFNEEFNEDVPVEDPSEETAIFYWEWY